MVVSRLPYIKSSILCCKLSKGMGHNSYGEPAWPNDILYIFPVVIFGALSVIVGLTVCEPLGVGEPGNAFATPTEILPEWYFYPTFNLLRILPSKIIGVLSMASVPVILLITPFIENINKYQNPFRRPIAVSILLISLMYSFWLGLASVQPLA